VKVGKVQDVIPEGDHAKVVMDLDSYKPLHQGATAQMRAKTLVEESFVEILDGTGPPMPSGWMMPPGSGKPPTQLNDVLVSLDGKTRGATGLGDALAGRGHRGHPVVHLGGGPGARGHRPGRPPALDALAAQSDDLKALTGNTAAMMTALNTQRGEIAQLVEDANRLTTATSDGQDDLKEVMRTLPPVLHSARNASHAVTDIGNALDPVARHLHDAGPDLSAALEELPDVSRDLRDLLPDLNSALAQGPGYPAPRAGLLRRLARSVPARRSPTCGT